MSKQQTTVRVDPDLLHRADALVGWLQGKAYVRALGSLSRSHVLRLALERGLTALEEDRTREAPAELAQREPEQRDV